MVALNGCYRELANIIERVQVFKKVYTRPNPYYSILQSNTLWHIY